MDSSVTQKKTVSSASFFIPLLVILSFMLMIIASSLYTRNMLRDHLRRDAINELTLTKLEIEGKLTETHALDEVINSVVTMYASKGGHGILFDENLTVIAAPDAERIGKNIREVDDAIFSALSGIFEQGKDLYEYEFYNNFGTNSILFSLRFDNGWILVINTPKAAYYRDLTNMERIIGGLGIIFAVTLIIILIRIDMARVRADEQNRQNSLLLAEMERKREEDERTQIILSELKAAQSDLRQARDIAEESNKAKSKFLANMSHEIRTPMNAILGITEIQLQNEALAPDFREALDKIYSSGDLLLNIINDILDLSKIEAGKLELHPAKYEIASLINDTVIINMMRVGSNPVTFELSVDANMPATLIGDQLRIKQILNNLLSNAFKYTGRGTIKLSVSVEGINEVTLVCQVSDTGTGMTEEQVSKLFNTEYTRFNTEANRTTEGTGLGMSITHNLVKLMNGDISVESEPGNGSVFTVRLPQGSSDSVVLGKELAERLQKLELNGRNQFRRAHIIFEPMPYGKVLVVDDVESNLYVAKGLMMPYGLSIDTAASGFAALDKIKAGKVYDIVFMDQMMPEMDGIETTQKMRGAGYTQPVIALTANAVAGQSDIFLANSFDDFIFKPIDIRRLDSVLKKYIRDKQPPEVIAAASRQVENETAQSSISPRLAEVAARDISKAISVLEALFKKGDNAAMYDEKDMNLYIVSVHALKSALANVGEPDLSAAAAELEQAGRAKDAAAVSEKTSIFLKNIQSIAGKFAALNEGEDENDEEISADEQMLRDTYLREKLLAIKLFCEVYDQKSAKNTLAELRLRKWPRETSALLETMDGHLLDGNFEGVIEIAARLCTAPRG